MQIKIYDDPLNYYTNFINALFEIDREVRGLDEDQREVLDSLRENIDAIEELSSSRKAEGDEETTLIMLPSLQLVNAAYNYVQAALKPQTTKKIQPITENDSPRSRRKTSEI